MPPTTQGQDTAVAVLQHQQESLEKSLKTLSDAVIAGFAGMNEKMDRLNDISLSIERVSAEQRAHSDGLGRAFGEISALRAESEQRGIADQQWRTAYTHDTDDRFAVQAAARLKQQEEHALVHNKIDAKFTFARGVLTGAGFLYTALVSLLLWAASTYIGDTRDNTARLHRIELENARHYQELTP